MWLKFENGKSVSSKGEDMSNTTCVIYVHGFGGEDTNPPFHQSMHKFFETHNLRLEAQTFSWPSLPITIETVIHNFVQSQGNARDAGEALAIQLAALEDKKINYHLIGFSLGAEVVRQALLHISSRLLTLKSIYFLGAAFNSDAELNESILPGTGRYHNYHSDNDFTLKISYFNVNGCYAAGSVGVTTGTRFKNYHTQCSHSLVYNYQTLAPAIGYMISWDEKQYIPGKARVNVSLPTAGGERFWHDICMHNDHIIQQNIHTGHFRALSNTPVKRRKSWSNNLHVVLSAI